MTKSLPNSPKSIAASDLKKQLVEAEATRMWMFGIARNLVSSQRRGWGRRAALAERLRDELALRPRTAQNEQGQAVRDAVAALPEPRREIVRLVHWDGFPLMEAAQITGVSASTARSRYLLARRRLTERLSSSSDEPKSALDLIG